VHEARVLRSAGVSCASIGQRPRIVPTLRSLLDPALSLLAPPLCVGCGALSTPEALLCGPCNRSLERLGPVRVPPPRGVDLAWAAAAHEGVAQRVVVAMKFGGLASVAGLLAARMAETAPLEALGGSLVAVPAAPARRRRRGFDPAAAIAAELAARCGLPLASCLRRADGPRQVGRSRADRLARPPRVTVSGRPPEQAVLVDDVVTTGATLAACAAALRAAGSHRVVALAFAWTR
jgi:predicted amidophosphoribosyltransferase